MLIQLILKKYNYQFAALSFQYEVVSYVEVDKQISLISFAWEAKYELFACF